ncbi:hypothetical protein IWW46_004553 [Coemansia sp. RSA 2440]|nr:hypothetical protein IWW46_004553 [Coemansia sp. RSA 2440]
MRQYTIYFVAVALLGMASAGQEANANGDYGAQASNYDQGSNDYGGGDSSYAQASEDDYGQGNDNDNDQGNSDYGSAGNDYDQGNNDYGSVANNYDQGNNDYASAGNDYDQGNNDYGSVANDYDQGNNDYDQGNNDYAYDDQSPNVPVVTPIIQTAIEDVVDTLIEYSTVMLQQTYVQSVIAQVTNVQIQSLAAQQDALYQVTQTYVCPLPPTVTVNNVNTVWVEETVTPTVQVVQTRVQPQVVVQPVTVTEQVQEVDVETQVIQEQATAVYTTSVHNMVQVVQQNVGQDQVPANLVPNNGIVVASG